MDFGLAGFDVQDEAGVEHGSGFSGTIAYAAPERIAGGRATPASDVYSLGLIAHEMLTNRRPIPGVSGASLADGGPVPAAWAKLIRRAIQPDPMARFANGAALAEALRNLNAGAATAARGAVGAVGSNDGGQARRRASVALIAGAALTLVLVAVARLPSSPREVAARSTRPRRGRGRRAARARTVARRRAAGARRDVARVGVAGRRGAACLRAAAQGAGRPSPAKAVAGDDAGARVARRSRGPATFAD